MTAKVTAKSLALNEEVQNKTIFFLRKSSVKLLAILALIYDFCVHPRTKLWPKKILQSALLLPTGISLNFLDFLIVIQIDSAILGF